MRWWPAGRLGSHSWGRGQCLGRSRGNDGDNERRRGGNSGITRGRSLDLLSSLVWRVEATMS